MDLRERTHDHSILLAREVLKIIVIVVYIVFAIWLLVTHTNPIGFAPLLPWALWSRGRPR